MASHLVLTVASFLLPWQRLKNRAKQKKFRAFLPTTGLKQISSRLQIRLKREEKRVEVSNLVYLIASHRLSSVWRSAMRVALRPATSPSPTFLSHKGGSPSSPIVLVSSRLLKNRKRA